MENFRTFLILILFFSFSGFLLGQTPKFTIAAEGSINYFGFLENYNVSTDWKNIGYSTGLKIQYNLNNNFSIKSGLVSETKRMGVSLGYNNCDECIYSYNYKQEINHLTLPLIFQMNLGKSFQFFFNVGTYISVLTRSQNSVDLNSVSNIVNINSAPKFKNYDFGGLWGMGVKIPIAKNLSIPIELGIHYGLANMRNSNDLDTRKQTLNTANLSFGLAYSFDNLKKN